MRIVLLTSSLGLGGAERVAAGLCNAWAERGDDVTLIATYSGGGKACYEIGRNVELIYLADVVGVTRGGAISYARRLPALRRLIASRSPDVIVSFLPNVNVAGLLSTAFLRIPRIICERSDPTSFQLVLPLYVLCRLTYRFADLLTVQTEDLVPRIERWYPGLKAVRAVPNALPQEVVGYRRQDGGGKKVLLSLGRLSREKQAGRLLRAFASVAGNCADWELHIYGDGPERAALEEEIQILGMQSRVFLKGGTNDPWGVMARSDAFAQASLFEGFPNALLEAMGIGLPCAAFDCQSGPREIMRDGYAGLLVPLNDQQALADALEMLMKDASLREVLGRRAREEVIGRYSLPSVLARWDELFVLAGVQTDRRRAPDTPGAALLPGGPGPDLPNA